MVTLYHWDLPNALDEQFGGLLNDSFRSMKLGFLQILVALKHRDDLSTSGKLTIDYLAVPILCSEMFTNYADLCFQLFGDSVKLWTTFNEPQESAIQVHAAFSPYHATALTKSFKFDEKVYYVFQGYGTGGMAPGRCSNRANCAFGNSSVEPYIVGHNILKAHAAAVQLYKSKYQVIKLWVRRWSD